ncbi:MAG: aldehyde dehydrogenase family protein, partial [Alphaproteobacteria bacterium]
TKYLAEWYRYFGGLADKVEGAVLPSDRPGIFNFTRYEPLGVIAMITAWNSPLLLLAWKLAPALAAGNTAVIKPSEHASCSTLALMQILQDAEILPPGVVNVVTGYGPTTGTPLVRHPDVRMVSFTGGTHGGRAVAALAAEQVKPVVMELGGKSPHIVRADADLDLAARGVANAIFPGGGQSCIAGSRLLIHAEIIEDFTQRLAAIGAQAVVGPPEDPATTIGPLANRPHYEGVLAKIDAAEAAGHRLVLDGRSAVRERGYYVGPTLFADVPNSAALAQTEVFGPVASTEAWSNDEDAIQRANDTPYGLAAGIWTADVALAMRMAARIEAGTVYINNYFNAATQSPVGGFKQSGYGRENGIEGMRCFMQTKSVWLATNPQ